MLQKPRMLQLRGFKAEIRADGILLEPLAIPSSAGQQHTTFTEGKN
jgi:hypothetical protein